MIRHADDFAGRDHDGYDVCIVGAGAAGITLALELAEDGRRVCLLEAGDESYDAAAQRLAEGVVEGDAYPPLRSTRMNALGGSTHVWAGWCRPLDREDFEARPAIGRAGWPFGLDALLPFYRRAHEYCGLAEYEYDPEYWRDRLGGQPLVADDACLAHAIFHVRVRNFGIAYRTRLDNAASLDVVLRATVSHLDVERTAAAPDSVRGVSVHAPAGARFTIRARRYVLAAGGIENARLLLLSSPDPARAPGNQAGLVGRCFSDHPFINPGWLVLRGDARRIDFYFPRPVSHDAPGAQEAAVRAALVLPASTREREELPGAALFFHPRYEAHPAFDTPEVRAALELREKLRSRAVPGAAAPLLRRAIRRPDRLAGAALRRLLVRDGASRRWRLRLMFEVPFHADNRVELGDGRDAFGRPRATLHWRVPDDDITRMRRTLAHFDAAFREAGVGHIVATVATDEAWRRALEGGKHHMGTTRMHADARHGVVDPDGRVHGTSNVYATGSSVFPGGGYANPTLTVVALALRLATHLKRTSVHFSGMAAPPMESRGEP